jgi:exodeoxyribonuclease-3
MKLATFNVNGIRARGKEVSMWAYQEKPDVLCLQEIKAAPEQIEIDTCSLPGYQTIWHGKTGGYSGVSIHVREEVGQVTFETLPFDMETRVIAADLPQLRVVCVYAPNGGKDYEAKLRFYEDMIAWVAAEVPRLAGEGRGLVLTGDLNIARADIDVHKSQRKAEAIGQRDEERVLFERLLAAGLRDVGREHQPDNDKLFTWWPYWKAARQRNLGWRIDYVLASAGLADKVSEANVRAEVGTSDHAPFLANFRL